MADITCELTTIQENYSVTLTTAGTDATIELSILEESSVVNFLVGETGAKGAKGDKGDPGDQRVFVQDTPPDFKGESGLWLQTGLENNGFTLWFEDGV